MVAKKKLAVRDKYYTLAKEQGYRARSAFKLVQLNRRYDLLSKAKRVIDLCAAPGGWLQVCVQNMPKTPETQVIGVDLMPIRPIRGVVTFQEDITSQKCKALIKKEMKGNKADLVLCDGAPNVGADYSKDAFVQNELTVHALKFACEHLVRGGVFITKVFRSRDYNALMWSFQQLFEKVEATKPESSRNVSAEIFVVCRNYRAPHKIDPRLLDPKHVLEQVDGTEELSAQQAASELFHKKAGTKKNRSGYDPALGQGLFKVVTAAQFVFGDDHMQQLAVCNKIDVNAEDSIEMLKHKATTSEILEYLGDVKVLGKSELRDLLNWRKTMRRDIKEQPADSEEESEDASDSGDDDSESGSDSSSDESDLGELDDEIAELKKAEAKKKKREKKKKARAHAKHQYRVDLGMENQFAVDLAEASGPFSLKDLGIKNSAELDAIREVNLSKVDGSQVPIYGDESESESEDSDSDLDPEERKEKYNRETEQYFEEHYDRMQKNRERLEPLSVQQRRQLLTAQNKAKMKKKTLEHMTAEGFSNAMEEIENEQLKSGAYLKMLKGKDSDDDSNSSDEESDEEVSEDDDEEEDFDSDSEEIESKGSARKNGDRIVRKQMKENPLLVDYQPKKVNAEKRAKTFFNQKLFDGVESDDEEERPEMNGDDDSESDFEMGLPSEGTDKMKRRERRAKLKKRNERKAEKRRLATERETGIAQAKSGFETVEGSSSKVANFDDSSSGGEDSGDEKTPAQRERERKAKNLIKRGMGNMDSEHDQKSTFEVVPSDVKSKLKNADYEDSDSDGDAAEEETYNSDDYDTDERAQHLALGSILTKKSKRRKLLDAAYNRYAFNDENLPDWFVEDENKHNRPQIPVSKEMVDAIKARYKDLMSKPINKVAEARGRKRKRAQTKVENAKRKAAAVAEQPDLTAKSKMRAIEKLYKGAEIKKPNSVYVVSKKGGKGTVNVKGMKKGQKVKLVDRRMKADQGRGMKAKVRKAKASGKRVRKSHRR